jgi:dienelactone hydrolase
MVWLWYPAAARSREAHVPYVSRDYLRNVKDGDYYGQSRATLDGWTQIATAATADAKPRSGKIPLIIFMPGAGVYGIHYSGLGQELASHGFAVAVIDYFAPSAPDYGYSEDDSARMEQDMARSAVELLATLKHHPRWKKALDLEHVGAAGHSIGGAAAISAARSEQRIRLAVDLDGAPFGESKRGTVVPALVLRSAPIYSDADLAKRGRTREQWQKMGAEARKTWADFVQHSGGNSVTVYSLSGTGHFSFSDAPFVMPDTITRFGGQPIAPRRGYAIITSCLLEFFTRLPRATASTTPACSSFTEVQRMEPQRPAN